LAISTPDQVEGRLCASRPGAAMPRSMIAGATGTAVTVSQARQAYCGWMSRRTKNSAGLQSSFSLTCSPIGLSVLPQRPQSLPPT
jgi:hypothetical protein